MYKLFVIFIIYGILGWIYECIFCIISEGKWVERGFLFGPICPIYGVGAVAITFIQQYYMINDMQYIFLISVIGSAILEYTTASILENCFHASWWDYYDYPFNIKGRVSLFSSLGFGIAGLLICFVLHPAISHAVSKIPAFYIQCIALLFLILFTIDCTLTINALISLQNIVIEMQEHFDDKMEIYVNATQKHADILRSKLMEKMPKFSFSEKSVLKKIAAFKYADFRKKNNNGL